MQHDPDPGRHEEQREIAKERAPHGAHPLGNAAPDQQSDEQKHHAEHGAGQWQAERDDERLADKLADKDQRQVKQHR